MIKYFLITILSGIVFSLSAQDANNDEYNKTTQHPETSKLMLTGKINQEGFQKINDFSEYYQEEYETYSPDIGPLMQILAKLESSNIRIILGTWCIDSKQQVPRFIKILEELNYPVEEIEMLAVDHNLEAKGKANPVEDYNLKRIPTFIFYNQDGEEIGRIVESPEATLEEDILKIFNK
ncbi:MAG: TlpA family protein disulfide reductase [Bacteroidales bacterium]